MNAERRELHNLNLGDLLSYRKEVEARYCRYLLSLNVVDLGGSQVSEVRPLLRQIARHVALKSQVKFTKKS